MSVEVEADVAESNVAKVQNGQPAEVTVEAIPDRRYKAVLRQVSEARVTISFGSFQDGVKIRETFF